MQFDPDAARRRAEEVKADMAADMEPTEEAVEDVATIARRMFGKQTAEQDPDSLAARAARMFRH